MRSKLPALFGSLLFLSLMPGCPADGIGDPCVPEEEYSPTFSGFSWKEVSTEARSFSCQSRLCLVNQFQGRVSCPYGQASGAAGCTVPGSEEPVTVPVSAPLSDRRADDAVYCSCRCDGPDPKARYCECPSGFSCSRVVPNFRLGSAQLPGSYCIKSGSEFDSSRVRQDSLCSRTAHDCDE